MKERSHWRAKPSPAGRLGFDTGPESYRTSVNPLPEGRAMKFPQHILIT